MRHYGTPGNPPGLLSSKSANAFTHYVLAASIVGILIGGSSHNDAVLGISFAVMWCITLIDLFARKGPYVLKLLIAAAITFGTIKLFHMSQATADHILQHFMSWFSTHVDCKLRGVKC